ncbi:MAG: serine hydrolase domain-containing protein [Vicinamibacterales bacterium]|jgi:CubicO group peptidase (beta-lactamase class C family)|nr:hypothetical protein [Acidobacteriota bacterium]MDP6373532.1 serine hydrolase domain-containing protein [Vicinamibacterales bacterium]MDP6610413.1 serine hydrolase domain-containing protein [Vicinamibacterales bacterium]HAK56013.1 hypothetical protein [Acidobacteriota bacterium]
MRLSFTGSLAVVSLAAAIAGCDRAANPTAGEAGTDRLAAAVRELVGPYVEGRSFSGVVLVARGDELLVHEGFGQTDHVTGTPMTVGSKFQIASLSKSFTAAAILRLRERNKLALDDPLSRFLPEFPRGADITIHQLLVHTSGLARYVFQPDYAERSRRPHSAADLVDWIAAVPLALEPGERSAYSNANYAVLARVIEVVSGQAFGEFLHDEVIAPAGLTDTGHRGDASVAAPDLAIGHVPVGLRTVERSSTVDYSASTGAGSIYSTAGDLLQWHRALAGDRVLTPASRALMFERHVDDRGYGWILDERRGRSTVSMSGWDGVGFSTEFVHFEEENLTVIVLCNLSISTAPTELADGLAALVLDGEATPLSLAAAPLDAALARELAGEYRFGADFYVPNASLVLSRAGNHLAVAGRPPGALLQLAEVSASGDPAFIHRQQWFRVTFDRDSAGRVSAMRYGPFEATRVAAAP